MPYLGGDSDKFGLSYEANWTIWYLLKLLSNDITSLRIEPPSAEEVEFTACFDDGRVCGVQSKRNNKSEAQWTIRRLFDENVLPRFLAQVDKKETTRIFVSETPASEFRELCERTRKNDHVEEFRLRLGQEQTIKSFDYILDKCRATNSKGVPLFPNLVNLEEKELFERLQRIDAQCCDHEIIHSIVLQQLQWLYDGNPASIYECLSQYAIEIRTTISASVLEQFMTERKFYRRSWDKDSRAMPAVRKVFDQFVARANSLLITDEFFEKSEVQTIRALLNSGERRIILSGEAGQGKSASASRIATLMAEDGFMVLPFRIDRPNVVSSTALGEELFEGLKVSPALLLHRLACGGKVVIIIDQLDALTTFSAEVRSNLQDTVLDISREVEVLPNVQILMVCREFDSENDLFLKRITAPATKVAASHFDEAALDTVLGRLCISANEAQRELLFHPFNLYMLASICKRGQTQNFASHIDLCDQFWDAKKKLVASRIQGESRWVNVIDTCLSFMDTNSTKEISREVLDEFGETLNAMASENVLVAASAVHFSFFHDSFSEYCRGRRFVGKGLALESFLSSGMQGLEQRSVVKAILDYKKERHSSAYYDDIGTLLRSTSIRPHIKEFIFSMLKEIKIPTARETKILAEFLGSDDQFLSNEAQRVCFDSPEFAKQLDEDGHLEKIIEQRKIPATTVLHSLVLSSPHRAQVLMRKIKNTHPEDMNSEWCGSLLINLGEVDETASDNLLDWLGKRESNDVTEQMQQFWWTLTSWSQKGFGKPVVRTFQRELDYLKGLDAGRQRPLILLGEKAHSIGPFFAAAANFKGSWRSLGNNHNQSSQKVDLDFLNVLVDTIIDLADTYKIESSLRYKHDSVWDMSGDGGNADELLDAMLLATIAMLRRMSADNPQILEETHLKRLKNSDTRVCRYLVLECYSSNGEYFAEEALSYLASCPEVWMLDFFGASRNWFGLVAIIIERSARNCSDAVHESIEKEVIRLKSDLHMWYFALLGRLDPSRLSADSARELKAMTPPPTEILQTLPKENPRQAPSVEQLVETLRTYKRDQYADACYDLSQLKLEKDECLTLMGMLTNQDQDQLFVAAAKVALNNEFTELEFSRIIAIYLGRQNVASVVKAVCRLLMNNRNLCGVREIEWLRMHISSPITDEERQSYPSHAAADSFIEESGRCWAIKALAYVCWEKNDGKQVISDSINFLFSAPGVFRKPSILLVHSLSSFDALLAVEQFTRCIDIDSSADQRWIIESPECIKMLAHIIKQLPSCSDNLINLLLGKGEYTHPTCGAMALATAFRDRKYEPMLGNMLQLRGARRNIANNCVSLTELQVDNPTYRMAVTYLVKTGDAELYELLSKCFLQLRSKPVPGWLVEEFLLHPSLFKEHCSDILDSLARQTHRLPRACLSAVKVLNAQDVHADLEGGWWFMFLILLRIYSETTAIDVRKDCLDQIDAIVVRGLSDSGREMLRQNQ